MFDGRPPLWEISLWLHTWFQHFCLQWVLAFSLIYIAVCRASIFAFLQLFCLPSYQPQHCPLSGGWCCCGYGLCYFSGAMALVPMQWCLLILPHLLLHPLITMAINVLLHQMPLMMMMMMSRMISGCARNVAIAHICARTGAPGRIAWDTQNTD